MMLIRGGVMTMTIITHIFRYMYSIFLLMFRQSGALVSKKGLGFELSACWMLV